MFFALIVVFVKFVKFLLFVIYASSRKFLSIHGTDRKFFRSFRFQEAKREEGRKGRTRHAVSNDGKLLESTRLRGSDDP